MINSDKIILELIRKALDGSYQVDSSWFKNANWAEVIEVASTQGVLGLCFEAIALRHAQEPELDAACRPDMDNLMDMLGQVEYMKTCYEEHRKAIEELAHFYADNGPSTSSGEPIKMMLLKGYGLSLYWPTPEHRPVGDIDIYLRGESLELRAESGEPVWQFGDQMVHDRLGIEVESGHEHHTTFSYKGIMVENHYDFINVKAHKDAPAIEAKLKELASRGERKVLIGSNGKESTSEHSEHSKLSEPSILLPSADFNVIFLIRHLGQHFAGERVTLRQLMDWGLFMQHCCGIKSKECSDGFECVHWPEIVPFLKEMGIWTFFCHINALCNDAFGLNITVPEFHDKDSHYKRTISDDTIDKNLVNRILEDILHPEFCEEKPQGLFPVLWFKMKRWWYNRWKHPLVYNEWLLPMFLTLLWSHIRRIDTIKD